MKKLEKIETENATGQDFFLLYSDSFHSHYCSR